MYVYCVEFNAYFLWKGHIKDNPQLFANGSVDTCMIQWGAAELFKGIT